MSQKAACFLGLPLELRNEVYGYLYTSNVEWQYAEDDQTIPSIIGMDWAPLVPLLCVNRQVQNEYLDVFSQRAALILNASSHLRDHDEFATKIPSYICNRLRQYNISIGWEYWTRTKFRRFTDHNKPARRLRATFEQAILELCGVITETVSIPPLLPSLRAVHFTINSNEVNRNGDPFWDKMEYGELKSELFPQDNNPFVIAAKHNQIAITVELKLFARFAVNFFRTTYNEHNWTHADQFSVWKLLPSSKEDSYYGFWPEYLGTLHGGIYRPNADAALVAILREAGKLRPGEVAALHPRYILI
ncbi:hypothetical protein H2203_005065 [Taxawa tesnikishii (nom. ined.)]|nr:hypothetical protein H2203_005065 [Dothideales sp. JES 119]